MVYESLFRLLTALNQCDYKGFDPYDGNSTRFRLLLKSRWMRIFNTYFHKFSPLNFRRVFGIEKSLSNQSAAFCLRALLNLPSGFHPGQDAGIEILVNHLKQKTLFSETNYHVWDGLEFPVQMLTTRKPFMGVTDIIAIEACGGALLDYCRIIPDDEIHLMFNSIIDYLMKYHQCDQNCNYWLKYYAVSDNDQITFNASALGSVFLRKIAGVVKRENEVEDFCKHAVDTIVSFQKSDGHWNYFISLGSGYEKPQIDFHQGFLLDALLEYMELTGFKEPYFTSYLKGLEYYHNNQFLPNGQSLYRVPKKWPADIQNQAQGIITFAKAARAGMGEKYLKLALTIAQWTINNMQNKDGHFYFLKYPLFQNRIRYVRWNDAPMAYALSVLLATQSAIQKKDICLESRLHMM